MFTADMHARPVVDRSSVWEEDGSPDSASRVPNIGDIDMSTVNRVLYQVCLRLIAKTSSVCVPTTVSNLRLR